MSVNIMTVRDLINKLKGYDYNMEVVVLRHPDYKCSSGDIELDGIAEMKITSVAEDSSVYNLSDSDEHFVLALNATEDLFEEEEE